MSRRPLTAFAAADAAMVRRDPFLRLMLAGPPLLIALVRVGAAPVSDLLAANAGVDAGPHYPVAASFFMLILIPLTFGSLIGLLLLDERDSHTLTALRVTPLAIEGYGLYRAGVAAALAAGWMTLGLPASGLLTTGLPAALPAVGLAAATAPLPGLALAAFATNKVEGMAVLKVLGMPLLLPVAAWFVDGPWHWGFAVIPTFWPAKALWQASAGQPVWPVAVGGLAYLLALNAWLARRFILRLERQGAAA